MNSQPMKKSAPGSKKTSKSQSPEKKPRGGSLKGRAKTQKVIKEPKVEDENDFSSQDLSILDKNEGEFPNNEAKGKSKTCKPNCNMGLRKSIKKLGLSWQDKKSKT